MDLHFTGVIIGFLSFLMIGIFHPLVIKTEYYWGKRIWPIYLILGLATVGGSLFFSNVYLSSGLGVFGFASLWTIIEMFEQEERVADGRFPYHPTAAHHAHIREALAAKEESQNNSNDSSQEQ